MFRGISGKAASGNKTTSAFCLTACFICFMMYAEFDPMSEETGNWQQRCGASFPSSNPSDTMHDESRATFPQCHRNDGRLVVRSTHCERASETKVRPRFLVLLYLRDVQRLDLRAARRARLMGPGPTIVPRSSPMNLCLHSNVHCLNEYELIPQVSVRGLRRGHDVRVRRANRPRIPSTST